MDSLAVGRDRGNGPALSASTRRARPANRLFLPVLRAGKKGRGVRGPEPLLLNAVKPGVIVQYHDQAWRCV